MLTSSLRPSWVGFVLASCPALLAIACGGPADEASFDPNGEAEGAVDFFDDEPPGESCEIPVNLNCPDQHHHTLDYAFSFVTGARQSVSFTRSTAPVIPSADTIACRATSDFVVGGITARGAFVPADVEVTPRPDGRGVNFSKPINNSALVPPDTLGGLLGHYRCGILCGTPIDPPLKDCRYTEGSDPKIHKGRLSIDGGAQVEVDLIGSLEDYYVDRKTGELTMTCKATLPKEQMARVKKRPNDVISASGARFLRGFDLQPTPRRSACYGLASMACQFRGTGPSNGINDCIDDYTANCISAFSGADPCRKNGFEDPH